MAPCPIASYREVCLWPISAESLDIIDVRNRARIRQEPAHDFMGFDPRAYSVRLDQPDGICPCVISTSRARVSGPLARKPL